MAREILSELRDHFADKMFKTVINFNTKIKEASSFGQPINEYDSASKGQRDFRSLAEEVISSEAKKQRRQMVNSLSEQLDSISVSAVELLAETKKTPKLVPKVVEVTEKSPASPEPLILSSPASASLDASRGSRAEDEVAVKPTPADTDQKLSEYYGVSQIKDALVFVTLYPRAKSVQIAGDFNSWQPAKNPMQKVGDSGVWQTKIKLPQGKYRYRLVVDGQWQQDPYNELSEMNPFGDYNSIIEVK